MSQAEAIQLFEDYKAGAAARREEVPWTSCPYRPVGETRANVRRMYWLNGWYQTDIGIRLREVFERNNILWP